MSFINTTEGTTYAPGYFLKNNEDCTRETRQFSTESDFVETAANGGKYIPMGSVYPSNDGNAEGFTYEDVDVTFGDAPGSVVTRGEIYSDRLALKISDLSASALSVLSPKFIFSEEPTVTRP